MRDDKNELMFYAVDADRVDYRYWVDADGKKIHLTEMSASYMNNVIKLLNDTLKWDTDANDEVCKRYIELFQRELKQS